MRCPSHMLQPSPSPPLPHTRTLTHPPSQPHLGEDVVEEEGQEAEDGTAAHDGPLDRLHVEQQVSHIQAKEAKDAAAGACDLQQQGRRGCCGHVCLCDMARVADMLLLG